VLAVSPGAVLGTLCSQSSGGTLWRVGQANLDDIMNTLVAAAAATVFMVLVALWLAWLWHGWPRQRMALVLGVTPLLLPPVMLGVAWLQISGTPALGWLATGLPASGLAWLDCCRRDAAPVWHDHRGLYGARPATGASVSA